MKMFSLVTCCRNILAYIAAPLFFQILSSNTLGPPTMGEVQCTCENCNIWSTVDHFSNPFSLDIRKYVSINHFQDFILHFIYLRIKLQ